MVDPTPITDAGLAELLRLEKAATPGPWVTDDTMPGNVYSDDATGSIVATFKGFTYAPRPSQEWEANARLTAAARNALPSLVHRLRTAEAERAALRSIADADQRVKAGMMDEINFFRDACSSLRARAEKAEAEVARLHERLEDNHVYGTAPDTGEMVRIDVEPGSIPDGISCRDETIRLQDKSIDNLRAQLAASRPDPTQPGQSSAKPLSDGAIYAAASRKNVSDAAVDEALGSPKPAADGYARYNRGAHMFGGDDE
jgi:hypothetical protein